jgi:voltage-gated potassium channel
MHIITLVRLYRRVRVMRSVGLWLVLMLLSLSILGNSLCFYFFDGPPSDPTSEISLGDALWYSVISITTIGYGDLSATSLGARWGTFLFVVVLGLATFTLILGMAIEGITEFSLRAHRGMSTVVAKDHILIVNFPSVAQVRQLIDELTSDPSHQAQEIVVVSDSIDSLPLADDRVLFVRGPVLAEATYRRARADLASMAIVLATSYVDPNSDAVVASVSAVLDRINPSMHIVAECLNHHHQMLFDTVHCDAIVFSTRICGNLLAQEAHDPGISRLVDVITSNIEGATLFSTEVTEARAETYNEIAKRLLDRDINLMCVNRNKQSITSFMALCPQPRDLAIYVAPERLEWRQLMEASGL